MPFTRWCRRCCCKTRRSSAPMHVSRNCRCKQAPQRSRNSGRQVSSTACGRLTAGANQSQGQQPQPGYPRQMPLSGNPGAPGFGSGGSFLGTAASAAAGVIGGSLLLDGIRLMFGHHLGGASASAFARGDDKSATYADREQDRQQDLADDDREQDRQQDLADEDAQQDAEQDLADEDAQQDTEQDLADEDSEQDLTDDDDFAGDDGYDA